MSAFVQRTSGFGIVGAMMACTGGMILGVCPLIEGNSILVGSNWDVFKNVYLPVGSAGALASIVTMSVADLPDVVYALAPIVSGAATFIYLKTN